MYCSNCGSKTDNSFCSSCGTKASGSLNKKNRQISSDKFRGKFAKVYREIDYIKLDIYKKKGIFFKNHAYSKEELLDSKHHKKIFSITGKIGDDVKNWHMRGKLSDEGRATYYEERNKTEDKLHQLKLDIKNREPTWWENIKGSLSGFVTLLMENIPELKGWLLAATTTTIGILPAPVGWVVGYMASAVNNYHSKNKRLSHQT